MLACSKKIKKLNFILQLCPGLSIYVKRHQKKFHDFWGILWAPPSILIFGQLYKGNRLKWTLFSYFFVLAITFYWNYHLNYRLHRWSRFSLYFLKTPSMAIFMTILRMAIMVHYDQNSHIEPLWPYVKWPTIGPLWVSIESTRKI